MSYAHTQRGGLHWFLWPIVAACVFGAVSARGPEAGWIVLVLLLVGGLTLALSFCFRTLTIEDRGDVLDVRYGPVALFRRRIPYAAIQSATPGRSRLIDGFGVHWMPGRGWTWNLWGFDCVELVVEGRRTRLGTDDREALVAFLQRRIAPVEAA
jgi:hypothetical protein